MKLALVLVGILGVLSGSLGAGGGQARVDNRLWWADFELRGPIRALRVDCAEAGETRVELELVAGEERRLALPLPVRSPLGAADLTAVSKPAVICEGEGQARFVGWAVQSAAEAFEALPPGLVARSRPVAASRPESPESRSLGRRLRAWVPLALVFVTWGAVAVLRRRPWAAAALVLLLSVAAFVLAARAPEAREPARVLEGLEGAGVARTWLSVVGGLSELELAATRSGVLVSDPASAALRFQLRFDGDQLRGKVRAARPGQRLFGLSTAAAWESPQNPRPALERVWTRTKRGQWSFHGAWPAGHSLPAALGPANPSRDRARNEVAEGTPAVPGWLAAGTPPGRALLVGLFADPGAASEAWVRVVGFGERD